jgi:hypothetical protein
MDYCKTFKFSIGAASVSAWISAEPQGDRLTNLLGKLKGKAIPLKVWKGPEDSRKLRLPAFMTLGT